MKKSIYFILFIAQLSYGQNAKIDSLKALLPLSKGSERIDILVELAYAFGQAGNRSTFKFGIESFKLATKTGDSLSIVKTGRVLSWALRKFERYDSSIVIGNYCEMIASRDSLIQRLHGGSILNGLGLSYLFMTKYDLALSSFLKASAVYEQKGDKESLSAVLNNLGLTFYKLADFSLALEYYKKSLRLKNSIGSNYDLDILKVNISICYAYLDSLKEARRVLEPILEKCNSKCFDNTFINAFYTSGMIWHKSDSLQKAEKDFLASYTAAKKIDDHRFVFDNIIYLSRIYLKQDNLLKAEQFLKEGQRMAINTPLKLEEMDIYKQLNALYKAKANYKKMSIYQAKYIQMNDSIFSENQTNNLMQLHAEATEKEYKTQLASQEQMLNLKNEVINKQLGINILIGVALLLLSILVYVLVRIFQDRKQANVLLTKKVKERTNELERNHRDLMTAFEHRDKALAQWTNTLNISVDSMRALCSTALSEELNPEAHLYFKEIDGVTSKVSKSLDTIRVI